MQFAGRCLLTSETRSYQQCVQWAGWQEAEPSSGGCKCGLEAARRPSCVQARGRCQGAMPQWHALSLKLQAAKPAGYRPSRYRPAVNQQCCINPPVFPNLIVERQVLPPPAAPCCGPAAPQLAVITCTHSHDILIQTNQGQRPSNAAGRVELTLPQSLTSAMPPPPPHGSAANAWAPGADPLTPRG